MTPTSTSSTTTTTTSSSTQAAARCGVSELFAELATVLDMLSDVDLAVLSTSELAAAVVRFQRLSDRCVAGVARFVAAGDAARVWVGSGNASMAGWLAEQAQVGFGRASDLSRLGEVLANDIVSRKVRDGELSTATVAALAPTLLAPPSRAGSGDVEMLLESCSNAHPRRARAVAEAWKAEHDPVDEVELASRRFARRAMRFGPVVDGMMAISGSLPALDANLARKALTAWGGGRPVHGDTRTPDQRVADGLLAMVRRASLDPRALSGPPGARGDGPPSDGSYDMRPSSGEPGVFQPAGGRQSARLVVLVPVGVLDGAPGHGWDEYGTPVPGAVVRGVARHARAADVETVVHDGSDVVAVGPSTRLYSGRSTRSVSRAIYTALLARDGHCRWPGCDRPAAWCEVDHRVPWEHGGCTDLDNLWLLCTHHHREKHRDGTEVTAGPAGTNGTVAIRMSNGSMLSSAPSGPITQQPPIGACVSSATRLEVTGFEEVGLEVARLEVARLDTDGQQAQGRAVQRGQPAA